MNSDQREKRRAYERATTFQRAYYERYYPLPVLGSRPPEPITPEVLVELERLDAAVEAARVAWESSRHA